MGRPRKVAVEDEWFDCFSRWTKSDREAALKVLGTLHRHLPDKPGKTSEPATETTDPKRHTDKPNYLPDKVADFILARFGLAR